VKLLPLKSTVTLARWWVAVGVGGGHVVLLAFLAGQYPQARLEEHAAPETSVFLAVVLEERHPEVLPLPEMTFASPVIRPPSLQEVDFVADEWGDISGVTAEASAPQLSRFQRVTPSSFARQAGLAPGQTASVVVTVEVLADGRTGAIEVTRGSGNPAVDEAAVAYCRQLHWIPGTHEHHAETMRVSLPVTLVWTA